MRFKVGDVVVVVDTAIKENKHLIGNEATVLAIHSQLTKDGYPLYKLDLVGVIGSGLWAEWGLRLKRPPLGSWQDIQAMVKWNPTKQAEKA